MPQRRAGSTELCLILESGLVAVVAIRDENGLSGHQTRDLSVNLLIAHDPETVLDTEVVGCHEGSAVAHAGLEGTLHLSKRVWIKSKDRAQVEPGGFVEGKAVGLGAVQCLLVGKDLPFADRLEPDSRQETLGACCWPSTSNVCS